MATAGTSSAAGTAYATGAAGAIRPAAVEYLGQIARSAEQLGFEAALTPTGAWCEDAWLTTAMLTEVTERLKFLVAFRPGLISPHAGRADGGHLPAAVPAAGCCSTSSPAARPSEQRRYGDFLRQGPAVRAHRRVPRHRARRLWQRRDRSTSHGKHLSVEGATLSRLAATRCPDVYFGGSSRGRGPGRRQVRRRLPDLGRAAGRGGRQDALDRRTGRRPRPRAALRHPAARDHPGHRRRRPGRQADHLMERVDRRR